MKHCWFALLVVLGVVACRQRQHKQAAFKVPKPVEVDSYYVNKMALAKTICSNFSHKTTIDSLLNLLTHQERVKVVATLQEGYDKVLQLYTYSDSAYQFTLKVHQKGNKTNSVFYDGNISISFDRYQPLSLKDPHFNSEDYAFNLQNTLSRPQIIEVCGKRFLYSNVDYWCNGMGCGCQIVFIYDLATHKATFLENYRIDYDGFFLSDVDNDYMPDLMVILSSDLEELKGGLPVNSYALKLVPFAYNRGRFTPKRPRLNAPPYGIELYTITADAMRSRNGEIFSITSNNWIGGKLFL